MARHSGGTVHSGRIARCWSLLVEIYPPPAIVPKLRRDLSNLWRERESCKRRVGTRRLIRVKSQRSDLFKYPMVLLFKSKVTPILTADHGFKCLVTVIPIGRPDTPTEPRKYRLHKMCLSSPTRLFSSVLLKNDATTHDKRTMMAPKTNMLTVALFFLSLLLAQLPDAVLGELCDPSTDRHCQPFPEKNVESSDMVLRTYCSRLPTRLAR
jgi:hypothetical protein